MDESSLNIGSLLSGFSISNLVAGILFGIIGYWVYRQGRKQVKNRNVFLGIVLMGYPYFVDNPKLTWGIGFLVCGIIYYFWDND
jgi:hypothetical protein